MKTINKCSFVNFYNVKASTGKQKLTLTITSGDFHLDTTWPPLLSGWKSPGVGIPGAWVIFAENLKVINAGKCSHRWHWQLAGEPHFVLFWWWTGSTPLSGLKVHVLNKMLWPFTASAHTRCRLFLAPTSFLWRRRRHIYSPACFSMKTTSWAGAIRAKLISVVRAGTRVIYSRAGFGQWLLAWLTSEPTCTNSFCPIGQGCLRRDLCVGILLHLR